MKLLCCALVLASACSRPVHTARTTPHEPTSAAEHAAAERLARARCGPRWGLLFPGIAQACLRQDAEAAALFSLGAAELATVVVVARETGLEHPGAAVPLLALSDLWVHSYTHAAIQRDLARQRLYAPPDSLADLVAAPFNVQVLRRPKVWAGTLVALGLGVGASLLLSGGLDETRVGEDPNLFGHTVDRRAGYPLALATGVGLFSHVAIAEEVLFRGLVQSSIARQRGETAGWVWSSVVFGLAHGFNAALLPSEERARYLLVGIPFLTVAGGYLGYVYRDAGYALAPPVAVHFWYDLLLSATFFALDPQNSLISARISVPF